jgi:hypothetical protein
MPPLADEFLVALTMAEGHPHADLALLSPNSLCCPKAYAACAFLSTLQSRVLTIGGSASCIGSSPKCRQRNAIPPIESRTQ